MDGHLRRSAGARVRESQMPGRMLPAVFDLGTPRSDENEAEKIRRKVRQHERRKEDL